MNKIYAFVIIFPFIAIFLFKAVAFYEYDTKQRYLKNQVDVLAYKVKITGVLTSDEYTEFRNKISTLSRFVDAGVNKCVIMKKGSYVNGTLTNWVDYIPGNRLNNGEAFMVYIKSSSVSNYSRLQNWGVNPIDSSNLYYKAKAEVRIEKND